MRVGGYVAATAVVVVSCLPLWVSLGDHPLKANSEARYAAVGRAMAVGESGWLVPAYMGQPHLTKPPLTYWAVAGSMRAFGVSEWSARLPGAVAGSLLIVAVVAVGWRRHGPFVGLVAGGLVGLLPLHVVVSRLVLTDPWLSLWWFLALVGGLTSTRLAGGASRRAAGPAEVGERGLKPRAKRHSLALAVLWGATALGLFTKGPAALLPALTLAVWLAAAGRWADLRRLRPVSGLVLAALPVAAWAAAVWWRQPDAAAIWRHEVFGRVAGDDLHPRPVWYFLPVFLAGLYPATVLLPWWTRKKPQPTEQATEKGVRHLFRSESALWAWAVVVPLVVFSLQRGKLMSYLAPLAAPIAVLVAMHLRSVPRGWLLVPAACSTLAAGGAAWLIRRELGADYTDLAWPLVLPAVGGVALWWGWPRRRVLGLTAAWLAGIATLLWGGHAEDRLWSPHGTPKLVATVRDATGYDAPVVLTVGYEDQTLAFYTAQPTRRADPRFTPAEWAPLPHDRLVLVADPPMWAGFRAAERGVLLDQRYQRVAETLWGPLHEPRHVYVVRPAAR